MPIRSSGLVSRLAINLLAAILGLLLSFGQATADPANAIPGDLKGDFSVSLGGSAQYNVPIAVPEGTSGMSPKLVLTYDSNGGPGSLGLGWSVGGLSYISRSPKSMLIDGVIAPVKFGSDDGLTLDGSRIIQIATNKSNRIFSRIIDDQSRVEEFSDSSGVYYVVRTKAGLRMFYGETGDSKILTKSGRTLIWACNRIEDTFGNAIEFSYKTNGFGDWGLDNARYTSNKKVGLKPYAELKFDYHEAANPIVSFLAGEELRRTLVLDLIQSGVFDSSGTFKLFRRYDLKYDETGDTNRFGSRRVRAIVETGAYGETHKPTTFDYSEPQSGWSNQKNYSLPEAFGAASSLKDGYRLTDLDSDGTKEIVYSANFVDPTTGAFTPYRRTYKLNGNQWQQQPDLNMPEALVTSSGTDTGALLYDVDGDRLLDIIVSSRSGDQPLVSKAYQQQGGKWIEKPEFKFPVPLSVDGKRRVLTQPLTLKSGERRLLTYDLDKKQFNLWSNDGSGWAATGVRGPDQLSVTNFVEADLSCNGSTDLVAIDEQTGAIGLLSFGLSSGTGIASIVASTSIPPMASIQVAEVAGCAHLVVKSAAPAKLIDVSYASGSNLDVTDISLGSISPEDIIDTIAGQFSSASSDDLLLRMRSTQNFDSIALSYDQAAKTWVRLNEYDLPLTNGSERIAANYLPTAVDTNGDGKSDIVFLPTTQIAPPLALINKGPGWELVKQYVPDIVFAQKDKIGIGPQFVDLNGDGLVDLVGNYLDENGVVTSSASINTANGWVPNSNYVTPMPLTNQKSGTTGVLVDIDADGLADFIYSYGGAHKFWKNKFDKIDTKEVPRYWVEDANYLPPPEDFSVERYGDLGVRFLDVNGDGRVEMLVSRRESDGSLYSRAYLNTGSGWIENPKYRLSAPFVSRYPSDVNFETGGGDYYRDLRGQLIDVNGDGLLDYVYRYRFNGSSSFGGIAGDPIRKCQNRDREEDQNGTKKIIKHPIPAETTCAGVLINTGAGWIEADDRVLPPIDLDLDITEKTASVDVLDINGDGFSDIVVSRTGGGSQTILNAGPGWENSAGYAVPAEVSSSNEKLKAFRFLDLNADGLIDVIYSRADAKGAFLNTGFGWTPAPNYAPPFELVDTEGKDLGVRTIDVDGNGRPDILQSWKDADGNINAGAYLNLGGRADTLMSVTNGMGLRTEFAYRSLLQLRTGETEQTQFYTPSPVSDYPIISHAPTTFAVEKMTTIEASDRKLETNYRYKGFRFDVTASMPLGFESREAYHLHNQLLETAVLNQSFILGGHTKSETTSYDGKPISFNAYDYDTIRPNAGNFPVRVVLKESAMESDDLNGVLLSKTINSFVYDEDNNAKETCVKYGDGSWTFTENQYDQSALNHQFERWYLGRLTKSTVTSATLDVPGSCKDLSQNASNIDVKKYVVSVASFTYDPTTGVLASETANAANPLSLTTTYGHDPFGNIAEVVRKDNLSRKARTTSTEFDSRGRFAVSETDAAGNRSTRVVDDVLGVVSSVTDANGVKADSTFDGFGRLVTAISATGLVATNSIAWMETASVDGQLAVFKSIDQLGSLPPTEKWMDISGRVIRTVKTGFGNRLVYQDTHFDVMGRVASATLPYFVDDPIYVSTTEYDQLNRPTKMTRADGAEIAVQYDGLSVITDEPHAKDAKAFRTTKKISNAKGLVTETVDQAGNSLKFEYGPADRLLRTVQIDGKVIENEYDENGSKVATTDPDLGHWDYKFDAFGEIIWQRDAKGQVTKIEYDGLGRPKVKTVPDKRTEWFYDSAEYGKGAIARVVASDGYSEELKYDRFGRLEERAVQADGDLFATAVEYDEYSRITSVYYPQSFVVKNKYDSLGFLNSIQSSDSTKPFGSWAEKWKAITRDQYGRVTLESFGNGIQTAHTFDPQVGYEQQILTTSAKGKKLAKLSLKYDLAGDLKQRSDVVGGWEEAFQYDNMHRLKSWSFDGAKSVTYDYDAVGRILRKSDVGYYHYDSAKPAHAVGSISNNREGKTKWTYSYDANGNMTDGPKGHFEYYADNSVRQIIGKEVSSDNPAEQAWSEFSYAPDGSRYMHYFRDGDMLTRTVSIGAYERVTEYGTGVAVGKPETLRHRVYLSADTGVVGTLEISTKYDPNLGNMSTFVAASTSNNLFASVMTTESYFTKDQLGSITNITDAKGIVTVAYRYDPWGRRWVFDAKHKKPDWLDSDIDRPIHAGFTGHEHLDHLNLIHMNGRVYDPTIARFVSADPTLQLALFGQNYDRYSYAANNPTRYVDPTGFGLFDVFEDIWNAVTSPFVAVGKWLEKNWRTVLVVAVVVVVSIVAAPLGPVAAGMLAGAASGGLSTALYGGSFSDVMESAFKGAVIGGISAGLAYGVGEMGLNTYAAAAAHGVTQGGLNAMQGGNFWQSFASGAFGSLAGSYMQNSEYLKTASTAEKIGAGAIAGGTGSVIGGGKFENGAVTGAFVVAFNHVIHDSKTRNLTDDEISESRKVYGDKIDYSSVRVHKDTFLPWQPADVAITPRGEIYYPSDSGNLANSDVGLLIHEMAHVLQYQNGVNVLLRGALLQAAYYGTVGLYNPYSYSYDPSRSFRSYNIEQQGDIGVEIYRGTRPNNIDY